ncbi:MAG: M48 family metalloprotease [Haliscomenobacter sp.]|nr:M48 family metalloprotease [Haliscomenobacter sp.]
MRNLLKTIAPRVMITLSLLIIGLSCAINPVTGKKELMLMSEQQEIALGVQSDPEVVASFGLYESPAIQAFITEKGSQMAAVSHRSELEYHFKVLDSPVVNAFALPGGFVYFTRGIMAYFSNEAEFAGVLGHEIGHITARHGARQQTTQILGQAGMIFGLIISKDFAQFADVASQALGILFLKFSREHETESDRLGVEYSTKIGYDAREMAGFFQTIKRLSGDQEGIPTFMSTHPDPIDRYNTVGKLAADWQQKTGGTNFKINRDTYLRMIDGIVYGEDPRQGYVENNVFYHPELRFQFPVPSAWKVQNLPTQVQMAPSDGKALILFNLAQEKDLRSAADATVTKDSLRQVEPAQAITVHGLSGVSILADQVNPQDNTTIRLQIYLIQYNNMIYRFYGMAYLADFNNYRPAFLNTMQQFRALTDQSKINVTPEKIKVRQVTANGTLASVLRNFNMPENRLAELAIVNGMELTTQVQKGMMIKTVAK